ncbi:MAG: chloride channel protein [Calditrichia bacterium]
MIPYVILGVLAALVALAFINILYKTEDLFEKINIPGWIKPVIGGFIIGGIGIFYPHIFGVGYDTITLALNSQSVWYFLLFMVFLKVAATSITIGSGGSGGVFAPSLFIGANLGGFVGSIVHSLFPAITASPGAYALVGMGAVAAGAMHAPITSILIIFELTNDYRIILPLMISCIISVLITSRLKKDSIYTLKLSRRGINIFQGQEVNVLSSLKASQVVKTDFERIYAATPFRKLMDLTVRSPHPNFFVVDKNDHLLGVISIHDIRKIIYESDTLEHILVAHDLLMPIRHYFTPNDRLDIVMKAFGEMNIDQLPVVDEQNEKRLIGTISKNDVIEIYNRQVFKRDMVTSVSGYISSMRKFKQVELMDGQILCEIEVPGKFVNKTLKELNLRKDYGVEVVLIKKHYDTTNKEKEKVITSSPDYRFGLGDSLLIMATQEGLDKIKSKNRY